MATTAMGTPTSLSVGGAPAVEITRTGVRVVGAAGSFLAAYSGATGDRATFPWWFAMFLLVPLAATLLGGRAAGIGEARWFERAIRGALAGFIYAGLCVVAAWAATLVVPAWSGLVGGSLRFGPELGTVFVLALAWGVLGCALGALVLPRLMRPAVSGPR